MMNTQTNESTQFKPGPGYGPATQKNSIKAVKENIAEQSREAAANVKEKARETKEKLMERGSDAAHQFQDRSRALAQERKHQLGDRIHGYGDAVHRAAEKLRDEKDPNIAHYTELVANRLHDAANYVQTRDVGSMLRDVENAARRRPEVFFGAMFVAGLALSRFLKASSQREERHYEDDYSESADMEESFPQESPMTVPATGAMAETAEATEQKSDWPRTGSTTPII